MKLHLLADLTCLVCVAVLTWPQWYVPVIVAVWVLMAYGIGLKRGIRLVMELFGEEFRRVAARRV